jgi:salicylate hydroxylase
MRLSAGGTCLSDDRAAGMSDAPHALIAGAGIGGLTAALSLAHSGFRVSLCERAAQFEDIGAGLQISPNASAILRDLGVLPRLTGALAPHAVNIRHGRDGSTIQRLPLDGAERRWGAPYLLVHRADLQKALLATVAQRSGIALRTNTHVADFSADKEKIDVRLRASEIDMAITADCLIGADGLRSVIRHKVGELWQTRHGQAWPSVPNVAHHVAWRTLINAKDVAPAFHRPESMLWLGPKAHVIHYPLRNGAVINVVAVIEDDVAIDWTSDLWSQAGDSAVIRRRFAGWHTELRALIGAATEWRMWPLVDLDPLPQWTFGRVGLMGDAAHPMLPFLAQGAAQAIEDAGMLGAMLSPQRPIEPCLAAYSAARRPRANRVQAASRRQGTIYHLGAAASFFRDLALRRLGPQHFLSRYDWLYRRPPDVA